jgi:4-carboxymuconolactone decarboxylase
MKMQKVFIQAFVLILSLLLFNDKLFSQEQNRVVRMAKIVVDSTQLESYKAALKENVEASVGKEPGVITLYAVYEKDKPTHVTVLEIYANADAYKAHLQTDHFKKYKSTVATMVKSLELTDVVPIALASKKP